MHHLPTAKAHGHLDLIAFLDEAVDRPHLHLVVVDVDVRPHLDLLDLDDLLLLPAILLILLGPLAAADVVEDLAARRVVDGSKLKDRKRVMSGNSGVYRVLLGGVRIIKTKNN